MPQKNAETSHFALENVSKIVYNISVKELSTKKE